MSVEEFKKLILTKRSHSKIETYVKQHKQTFLMMVLYSDDFYTVLLNTIIHKNIKYFADSKYPWDDLTVFHVNSEYSWLDVNLQVNDLCDRINDLDDTRMYYKILVRF
jgi:hypothetical protein